MSTLSEHTGNGTPTATSQQREDTKEQIESILQHFDVLPSKLDRFIFKYIYVYLIGFFFPMELLFIISLLGRNPQVGDVLLQGGVGVLSVVIIILFIWSFNVWRLSTPETLRDLLEKKLSLPNGDANRSYLHWLENYHDALGSPKRYFLSCFLMILYGLLISYEIVQTLSVEHSNIFVTILVVGRYLLTMFVYLGGLYCIGTATWAIYISGWYVRKLVRAFQFRIQSFHPDQCGGLTLLGNFCFGLVSPLVISSGLFIGLIIFDLLAYSPSIEYPNYLALTVAFPLLLLLMYNLPVIVLAFMLPLRDIHVKMVSEGKTNENIHVTRIEALREEIHSLLDTNQVKEAKDVQEKKALVEILYTPCPTWPFRFRSKISSGVLAASGSLFLGAMAVALQKYFLPGILLFFFHIGPALR
jgi:hypothetical protein